MTSKRYRKISVTFVMENFCCKCLLFWLPGHINWDSTDVSRSFGQERSSLTSCRLNDLSQTIYWKILISILGMSGYVI